MPRSALAVLALALLQVSGGACFHCSATTARLRPRTLASAVLFRHASAPACARPMPSPRCRQPSMSAAVVPLPAAPKTTKFSRAMMFIRFAIVCFVTASSCFIPLVPAAAYGSLFDRTRRSRQAAERPLPGSLPGCGGTCARSLIYACGGVAGVGATGSFSGGHVSRSSSAARRRTSDPPPPPSLPPPSLAQPPQRRGLAARALHAATSGPPPLRSPWSARRTSRPRPRPFSTCQTTRRSSTSSRSPDISRADSSEMPRVHGRIARTHVHAVHLTTRLISASRYISKAEILNIPVIGWAMRFAKHIAIRRTDRASQLATFKARPRLISACISACVWAQSERVFRNRGWHLGPTSRLTSRRDLAGSCGVSRGRLGVGHFP